MSLFSFKGLCGLSQHHRYFLKGKLRISWQSVRITNINLPWGLILSFWCHQTLWVHHRELLLSSPQNPCCVTQSYRSNLLLGDSTELNLKDREDGSGWGLWSGKTSLHQALAQSAAGHWTAAVTSLVPSWPAFITWYCSATWPRQLCCQRGRPRDQGKISHTLPPSAENCRWGSRS